MSPRLPTPLSSWGPQGLRWAALGLRRGQQAPTFTKSTFGAARVAGLRGGSFSFSFVGQEAELHGMQRVIELWSGWGEEPSSREAI